MSTIAAYFHHEFNLSTQSTISLFSPNHVDYVPICLAVGIIGAKVVPINPLYTVHELVTILNSSKSNLLVVHENMIEVGLEAVKQCDSVKHVVMIPIDEDNGKENVPEGVISLESLKEHGKPIFKTVDTVCDNIESHPVVLPYSSGTTGKCQCHFPLSIHLVTTSSLSVICHHH